MLHQIHLVGVHHEATAVDGQDYREAEDAFRGCCGDDEQREELPHAVGGGLPASSGNEGEVHRVEHQLQGHEDADRVLAGDGTVDAEREKDGAEYQVMRECYGHFSSSRSFPTIAMAAMRADRRRTDTSSKGRT